MRAIVDFEDGLLVDIAKRKALLSINAAMRNNSVAMNREINPLMTRIGAVKERGDVGDIP